jgi:hypothetical protein
MIVFHVFGMAKVSQIHETKEFHHSCFEKQSFFWIKHFSRKIFLDNFNLFETCYLKVCSIKNLTTHITIVFILLTFQFFSREINWSDLLPTSRAITAWHFSSPDTVVEIECRMGWKIWKSWDKIAILSVYKRCSILMNWKL